MKIPKIILASVLCVLLLVGCVSSPQEKWDLPTNEDGTVTVYLPVESTMDIYMSIPNPMEPETTKLLYHYTEDGWETADPSADWGGDQGQRFSYDEYGKLTQLQAFKKSGSAYERRVYEYNEMGQLIAPKDGVYTVAKNKPSKVLSVTFAKQLGVTKPLTVLFLFFRTRFVSPSTYTSKTFFRLTETLTYVVLPLLSLAFII